MAKAKKAKAKKTKAKKSKSRKTKKAKKVSGRAAAASRSQARRTKAKKSKSRGTKKARKAAKPKARAKKAAPRKNKQIVGEGDYRASRSFLKDEADFVKRHSSEIPAMGRSAEAALDGAEGGQLRAAEEEARSHSKAPGE